MTDVQGHTEAGFGSVRTRFEENFSARAEFGAGVTVIHRGRTVVDLWGGRRDSTATPWMQDTLVMIYSTTKPLAAACALVLADRSQVDLDERVSRYWPEFGQAGKDGITVRQMLSHQAGLIALREDLPGDAIFDRERIVRALEREEPWWPPGTAHGEHAYFFGHLIDELIRRIDGRSLRDFFSEEIALPWKLDLHIPVTDLELARVAELVGLKEAWPDGQIGDPGTLYRRAIGNPPAALLSEVVNSERWRKAEVPAINGYGTAHAIARFYVGLLGGGELDGVRILSEEICREATSTQVSGIDRFLDEHAEWGLGFALEDDFFGHGGLGGSIGYGLRDLDLAVAYVTNRMADHDRADAVLEEAERCARSLGAG
jgi:CubicO group peptidase (beta-lactamase class C family)